MPQPACSEVGGHDRRDTAGFVVKPRGGSTFVVSCHSGSRGLGSGDSDTVKRRPTTATNAPLFTPAGEYAAIMELVKISRTRACNRHDLAAIASRGRDIEVWPLAESISAYLKKWNLQASSATVPKGHLRLRRTTVTLPSHRAGRRSVPVQAFIVSDGRKRSIFLPYLDNQSKAYLRLLKSITEQWPPPTRPLTPKPIEIVVVEDVEDLGEGSEIPVLFAHQRQGQVPHPYADAVRVYGDRIRLTNAIAD